MARTYRALAALLSYPTEELQAASAEIAAVLNVEGLVSTESLTDLLRDLRDWDIYELQERYVDLFDRGRAVSLHLFEHVHGESRDRGQAMADLIALYNSHGLEMTPGRTARLPPSVP